MDKVATGNPDAPGEIVHESMDKYATEPKRQAVCSTTCAAKSGWAVHWTAIRCSLAIVVQSKKRKACDKQGTIAAEGGRLRKPERARKKKDELISER